MPKGIDPAKWLEEYDPGVPVFGALDTGRMVLAAHKGNVWIALHANPELRMEVALAWLAAEAQAAECGRILRDVEQLGVFIEAEDGVAMGGS